MRNNIKPREATEIELIYFLALGSSVVEEGSVVLGVKM